MHPHGPKIDVVLLSQNAELAQLRAKVLELSGCAVRVPRNREEAQAVIEERPPDVLVIAYTLSKPSAVFFSNLFRQRNSRGRIVVISESLHVEKPSYSDCRISATDPPDRMIAAVRGTLEEEHCDKAEEAS